MGRPAALTSVPKCKNLDNVIAKSQDKEWKTNPRHASASGNFAASAYNPVSGTFHALDPLASDSSLIDSTGKLGIVQHSDHSIQEKKPQYAREDHTIHPANTVGTSGEYDTISNNGSCSGESEDQQVLNKDKHGRIEALSLVGHYDKREKIRGRNEKKHQRQKERRAKQLRDRSMGFIMSHKLKGFAEQLAGMGFSLERANRALILNGGHVENSIAWLLEGGEILEKNPNLQVDLKLDISEELFRIEKLEADAYSRSDIDKAVVACQGDLDRAVEWLGDHRLDKEYKDLSVQPVLHDQPEKRTAPQISNELSTSLPEFKNTNQPHTCFDYQEEAGTDNTQDRPVAPAPWTRNESTSKTMVNCPISVGRSPKTSDCNMPEDARPFWSTMQDLNLLQTSIGEGVTHLGTRKLDASECYLDSSNLCNRRSLITSASSNVIHLNEESDQKIVDPGIIGINLEHYQANLCGVEITNSFTPLHRSSSVPVGRILNQNMLDSSDLPFSLPSSVSNASQLQSPNNLSSELWTGWGSGAPLDWRMQCIRSRDYKSVDWSTSVLPSAAWTEEIPPNMSFPHTMGKPSSLDLTQSSPRDRNHLPGDSMRPATMSDTYDLWGNSKFGENLSPGGTTTNMTNRLSMAIQEWTSPFAGKDLFTLPRQAILSTL